MARRRKMTAGDWEPPTEPQQIAGEGQEAPTESRSEPETDPPRPAAEPVPRLAHLRVPLGPEPDPVRSYIQRHVEVQLDPGQAVMMRRLVLGLQSPAAGPARLANGRLIQHPGDALKWLLEQLPANGRAME